MTLEGTGKRFRDFRRSQIAPNEIESPPWGDSPDSAQFTGDQVDLEAFRARFRKITDEELIREGKAGRYMCSPQANFGKPPRKVFVVQLESPCFHVRSLFESVMA